MLPLFYGALLVGAWLLYRDIAGRSHAPPATVRFRRRVALVAAAGPGIAPIIYFGTGSNGGAPSISLIGVAYLVLYLIFALGLLDLIPSRPARHARRTGYAGLLLLGALPSWGLLYLALFTAVAGIGLVEAMEALSDS
jgi:hypothetical protein